MSPPCLSPEKPTLVRGRGGVSPEGQVARMPVDVRGNFFKFIKGRAGEIPEGVNPESVESSLTH
jgi:hypothetical protein